MYHSIVLQAYWFDEGQFWNIGASGYDDSDIDGDDPDPIETDPHCLTDHTEDEIKEVLYDLAQELMPKTATHVCILLNGTEIKTVPRKVSLLRVCLDTDGKFVVWPYFPDMEDYGTVPLKPENALRLMTSGRVPIEIATKDPDDKQPHNYEPCNALLQLQRV